MEGLKMSDVIQSNFKQVRREKGHRKITQQGVENLKSLQRYFLNTRSASSGDIDALVNALTDILDNEIHSKYQITDGHTVI